MPRLSSMQNTSNRRAYCTLKTKWDKRKRNDAKWKIYTFPNGLDSTSVTNTFKNTTTLMFQISSSAIVSVTLKFLQDNSYIYISNWICQKVPAEIVKTSQFRCCHKVKKSYPPHPCALIRQLPITTPRHTVGSF